MANVPLHTARVTPGEDAKRVWIEHEVQCDHTVEGDGTRKNPSRRGYVRFFEDRGRTGKGLCQFWSRDGGLRTVDVEDVVHVGSTSMKKKK